MFDNFFKFLGSWYPFRWFIVIVSMLLLSMTYADFTGWRLLSWGAGGPGGPGRYSSGPMYHK